MELFTAELEEILARIQSLPRHIRSSRRHAHAHGSESSAPNWTVLLATLQELGLLVGRLI